MKTLQRLSIVLCLALVVGLVAQIALPVQTGLVSSAQAASKLRLNATKLMLETGETYRLKVLGTEKKPKWSSSNKRVAKVSSNGKVTALRKGKAKITAKVGSKKLTCTVSVANHITQPTGPIIFVKPIIYLYPEEETEVIVKLGRPEIVTTSYPTYTDGWRVLAQPDGTLKDLDTGRGLYALYWEGSDGEAADIEEGFVVAADDAAAFLEEKLAALGLSDREAEEFIVYWLPIMQESPYNLVRFETMEEIDGNMPLEFSVAPDTVIRVMMDFKPLDEPVEIPEQVLPETPARKGFTVVEWGGSPRQ